MAWGIITQQYMEDLHDYATYHQIEMANKVLDLYVQQDPDFDRRMNELIALQNYIHAIRYYDIMAEILTEKQILHIEEMIYTIIQNCPY